MESCDAIGFGPSYGRTPHTQVPRHRHYGHLGIYRPTVYRTTADKFHSLLGNAVPQLLVYQKQILLQVVAVSTVKIGTVRYLNRHSYPHLWSENPTLLAAKM